MWEELLWRHHNRVPDWTNGRRHLYRVLAETPNLPQQQAESTSDSRGTSSQERCSLDWKSGTDSFLPRLILHSSPEPAVVIVLQSAAIQPFSRLLDPGGPGIQYVPQPVQQCQDPQLSPGTGLHQEGPWGPLELHVDAYTGTVGCWDLVWSRLGPRVRSSVLPDNMTVTFLTSALFLTEWCQLLLASS